MKMSLNTKIIEHDCIVVTRPLKAIPPDVFELENKQRQLKRFMKKAFAVIETNIVESVEKKQRRICHIQLSLDDDGVIYHIQFFSPKKK
jgi:hypothetical protein